MLLGSILGDSTAKVRRTPGHWVGRGSWGSTERGVWNLPLWVLLQVIYEGLAYFKLFVTVRDRFQWGCWYLLEPRDPCPQSGKDISEGRCPHPSGLSECKPKIKCYFGLNTPPHEALPHLILCWICRLEHEWFQISVTVGRKRRVWAILVTAEERKREERLFPALFQPAPPALIWLWDDITWM